MYLKVQAIAVYEPSTLNSRVVEFPVRELNVFVHKLLIIGTQYIIKNQNNRFEIFI